MADLITAAALCVPLGIAAVATFLAPHRIWWIVAAGIAFAALVLGAWFAMFYDDGGDEWDTQWALFFAFVAAAVMFLLWLIGVSVGWATRRAVRREAAR